MMRFRFRMLIAFIVLALVGCGGGGTGGGGQSSPPVYVTVTNGQGGDGPVGKGHVYFVSGTFSSQSAQVTLTEKSPPRYNQPAKTNQQPMLVIDCPEYPNQPITVKYPDSSSGELTAIAFDGNKAVGAFPAVRSNGQAVVTIEPQFANKTRGTSATIALMLVLATAVDPPDGPSRLELVSGSIGNRNAVMSHGFLQGASDVRNSVIEAKNRTGANSAWVFHYNYLKPFKQVGQELSLALKNAGLPAKSTDLYGYSKGGLGNASAMQQFGETKAIARAIFLGTPFWGCNLGLSSLYYLLGGIWANSPISLPFFGINDQCIRELLYNSSELNELNSYQYAQHGDVAYSLFNGDGDNVVSRDSAWAVGAPIGDLTNGSINFGTLNGFGHMELDSTSAIDAAIDKLSTMGSGLVINCYPGDHNEVIQPDPFWGSWRTAVTISNLTGQYITLNSHLFEEFNRLGQWQGNYWYVESYPPGIFFPHTRTDYPWGRSMAPGEQVTLYIEFWPDESQTRVSQAPPIVQARTSHMICSAVGQYGTEYKAEYFLRMGYAGLIPDDPSNRGIHDGEPTSRVSIGQYQKPK